MASPGPAGGRYALALYIGLAVLFLGLFVINLVTRTWLGAVATAGLAAIMAYRSYRAWSRSHGRAP
jgi:hypothetical protein